MLAKDGQRVLRCTDCGEPDPLASLDTQGWFKANSGSRDTARRDRIRGMADRDAQMCLRS
jgi:hypothetical protein